MKLVLKLFPLILPWVVRWAEGQEKRILREGVPLSDEQMAIARLMGVANPEKIRILKVASIPPPGSLMPGWAAKVSRHFSPHTSGMSLRYGIFIRQEYWSDPYLMAHECVHTAQYERRGASAPTSATEAAKTSQGAERFMAASRVVSSRPATARLIPPYPPAGKDLGAASTRYDTDHQAIRGGLWRGKCHL